MAPGGPAPPNYPSAPVVNEGGDGNLLNDIPIDKNGNGSFLDDGSPAYRDGKARADIYYKATKEHEANGYVLPDGLAKAPFRDSKIGRTPYTYLDIDPSDRPQRIAASGIAVYNRGGWFDYHDRDTVEWFATLQGRTPARLMMGPTPHSGFPISPDNPRAGPYFAYFGERGTTAAGLDTEKLRFFDRYVKGVDNGLDREPPVMIYVMGRGWRAEPAWPLKREVRTPFHFGAGHALTAKADPAGTDAYKVDFTADSRSAGDNRWNYGMTAAKAPMTFTASDRKRLSYTSAPLTADMEVTGHPIAHIRLSSTAPEGDVFVYLEEVDEQGEARLVTEGVLRANFAVPRDPAGMIANAGADFRIRPALPWHGFRKADYVAAPFKGGKVVELTFDLMPTSWVFRTGRRIRVSVAGADHPSFRLHPVLVPDDDASHAPAVTWTVTRGAGGSYVDLPVIPAG